MQEHPSKLMLICTRKNDNANAKPQLITSAEIGPLKKNKDVTVRKLDLDLNVLKNKENVSKIRD